MNFGQCSGHCGASMSLKNKIIEAAIKLKELNADLESNIRKRDDLRTVLGIYNQKL